MSYQIRGLSVMAGYDDDMQRVLGALRQSRTREHSISLEEQERRIRAWAAERGKEVVGFTRDPSTSGGKSPFERPGLGPYLTEPEQIVTWDILVTTKLDRACRNAGDYLELRKWCLRQGKAYVSIAESIDDSTAAGRAMGTVIAAFAEFERDRASERALDRAAYLKDEGRWPGGRIPFGYKAQEASTGGWVLVADDGGTAEIARRMVRDTIGGKLAPEIARWLNAEGIPTGIGREWVPETTRFVIASPHTAGLLTDDEQAELTAALRGRRANGHPHREPWTSGEHMLLRIAYCWRCKDNPPVYGQKRGKRPDTYYCPQCWGNVHKSWVEGEVDEELRARWGDREYRVRAVRAGDNIAKDIRRLEAQLETAAQLDFVDTSGLEAEIDRLRELPRQPDRVEFVPTGQTIAEKWDSLKTVADKGAWLRANRVRVLTGPGRRRGHPIFMMDATWFASWE